MKLNNNALQELYDTIVNYTITFPPYYGDSPIDKAFKECDEKLSDSIAFVHVKDLQDRNDILEKELDVAKKNVEYFRHRRDDWMSGAKHAEKEVEDLKKELTATRKDYDELTKNYQDLSIKLKRCQINVGRESRFLWDMLQNVNDAKPFELATCFPDVTCMDDILTWDLEDFLECYEEWQEKKKKKEIVYMRNYLERFCLGRPCCDCPLDNDEFMCDFDDDENLKRYYEKVINYNKRAWHGDATWTCTLEGTINNVEINKDLLNKVCGIDSDD